MAFETLLFKEVIIFPELFLGISLVYLVTHCTFLSMQKSYPLIQHSVLYLGILVLFFSCYLIYNECLSVIDTSVLNNTIVNDYTSFSAKLIIVTLAIFSLIMMKPYLINQKINNFEYILLILFSILGLLLLCSSNDLLTAYLAIELQSLSFYVLAAFKKNSTFSVDAGVKYFIFGAFASSLFLFGSSLLYGITGTINFDDFKIIFMGTFPEKEMEYNNTIDIINYFYYLDIILEKVKYYVYFESPETNIINCFYQIDFFNEFFKIFLLGLNNFDLESLISGNFDQSLIFISSNDFLLLDSNVFNTTLIKFALVFILISLFFKLAVAPFHVWSLDVYEGSPSSSTFFFSVVPKLAIFVLLLRIFYTSFGSFIDNWRYFIVVIVTLSVIIGSFGGLEQKKLKTLLVYSTISHMGYSLIAFCSGTFESIQILISYLIIYSFSGLCVWSIFISTKLKNNYFQKQNKDLTDLVLLGNSNYMLAIFFTVVLFSVAGFPPMIGFLVKMGIFLSAIESSMFFVALISILCSVVGTFYYIRLIKILYFEKVLVGKLYYPINFQSSVIITVLFFSFIFLFINPTLLFLFSYKFSILLLN